MGFDSKDIRNIALFGHGYSGKTTVNEAMLFDAKMIPEMGRIQDGKTVSDYAEQEIARKMSIHSSVSHLEWNKTLVNIIDCPGSSDFIGEVVSAMNAANSGVFIINAENGLEIETVKIWRKCRLPRMVFINKMDKEKADYERCLGNLKENFKDITFVPLTIPIGNGKDFKGIVDLVDREARYFEDGGRKIRTEKVPDHYTGFDEHEKEMIETAVESDEELMAKYFDGKELTHEEILFGLKKSIVNGTIVPVLCGEAFTNSGTAELLDCIVNYMPSPVDVMPRIAQDEDMNEVVVEKDITKPAILFVFKTAIDQFSGKLSYFKVLRGQAKSDTEYILSNRNLKERCGKVFKIIGKTLKDVDFLNAGDIGVFIKLNQINTNDTLCDPRSLVVIHPMTLPQPIYSQAISTPNKTDEERLITLLQKAHEEDLTFKVEFNPETHQNVISGMGETQIKLILDKIKEKNKIETYLSEPKIAYRETIRKKATAEYTHKKQSGGHGQFGKVAIDIYPIDEGKHYEFVNAVVGGAVSKGYIPGCEKGFHDAMDHGVLAGFKVVDVGIRLFDGKEHPVDSSEMSFKIASRMAFKESMKQANPVLLEPVMELSVYAEEKYVGDILSDLSAKRGKVTGEESLGSDIELIRALVPQKELLRYAVDLKSITSGTASFEMRFHGYQALTGKIADDIISVAKKDMKEEEE
jgi:elongation factor G